MVVALLIGILLAVGSWYFARITGLEKNRSFYPTVIICIAVFYVFFAAHASTAMLREVVIASLFSAAALVSAFRWRWLIVAALVLHGAYDILHPALFSTPVAPSWWAPFCAGYDLLLALLVAYALHQNNPAIDKDQSISGRS